ncbi:predicted protein [Botrytis cinerea T4]|uniref:Uncharacterized protein n=1 Tax=Botryotinia fuckeliana (strain T4) TaxID=999810 RepID=G2Y7S4_BOTF4|nr:predicted protein [Botrytis cinerea T4]
MAIRLWKLEIIVEDKTICFDQSQKCNDFSITTLASLTVPGK